MQALCCFLFLFFYNLTGSNETWVTTTCFGASSRYRHEQILHVIVRMIENRLVDMLLERCKICFAGVAVWPQESACEKLTARKCPGHQPAHCAYAIVGCCRDSRARWKPLRKGNLRAWAPYSRPARLFRFVPWSRRFVSQWTIMLTVSWVILYIYCCRRLHQIPIRTAKSAILHPHLPSQHWQRWENMPRHSQDAAEGLAMLKSVLQCPEDVYVQSHTVAKHSEFCRDVGPRL